ncbi:hypothetical protein RD792_005945 [Penstemon davidsonii]|uniref:Sulfhydryl oxidase n=1 Tax=Penstemon davidsonii TaxID=160366 RepID=A0ABR0DEN8_9LAMI|nr:hypothetical protein RD792_005945 [Penstemon davidsonii]
MSSCVLTVPVLILTIFVSSQFVVSISSPFAIGSRSILRSIDENQKAGIQDYVVELNATNFGSVLKETPATYAVVEFFANWCPACRNYKPQYEKVAKLFNGPDAIHPGIIFMTRVDCALKVLFYAALFLQGKEMLFREIFLCKQMVLLFSVVCGYPLFLIFSLFTCLAAQVNTDLCNKFSVSYYPMLLWGPPSKFVSGSWDPKQEKSEIRSIDDGRTADRLLSWINKQISSSYSLDDQKYENDHLQTNASDPGQIARAIYDVEEATSAAFDIILEHKNWMSSVRCRKGTAEILVDFDDISENKKETGIVGEKGTFKNYHICGKDVPRGYWMFCRGSKNETRGFSCGLWVLLHSLSVRVEDGESHTAFTTICDFIHNFFICEECRHHFQEMCSNVSKPFKKSRDFVLWLWNAHNKVNERLMKVEESAGTVDPKFPKIIWPSRQHCPSCYASQSRKDNDNSQINWDSNEVYKFLIGHYGKTLVSLYKDKELLVERQAAGLVGDDLAASTHAVVVPVGAALAIAVASCAFGALACYWRQQQKSRKYKYLHSLKSI